MRPTRLGLILATITVIAPIAAFPDSATSSDDRLIRLSVLKAQYALGEKIVVTVTFLNAAQSPVDIVDDCYMRGSVSFIMCTKPRRSARFVGCRARSVNTKSNLVSRVNTLRIPY
jgi:hypothetical protein